MSDARRFRSLLACGLVGMLSLGSVAAHADAVESLRAFAKDVKFGKAEFTQTVTSPDGVRKKVSTGRFEFARPNHFRFTYLKPYAQTIVSDGQKVWFHDPDLNQVTVRKLGDAIGATPAALLAGQQLEKDFELKAQPDSGGMEWVQATPRSKDGSIQWMKAGFKGRALAAVEVADSFGQHSMLHFSGLVTDQALPAETFRFTIPAGTDISEQ